MLRFFIIYYRNFIFCTVLSLSILHQSFIDPFLFVNWVSTYFLVPHVFTVVVGVLSASFFSELRRGQQCVYNCTDNEQLFFTFSFFFLNVSFPMFPLFGTMCLFVRLFLLFLLFWRTFFTLFAYILQSVCICYAKRPQSVVFDMCSLFKQISLQRTVAASCAHTTRYSIPFFGCILGP